MPTAAQWKKELAPLVLVGKGALGKLDAVDLEALGELVRANQLGDLVLDVVDKRLVKLKARVHVPEVTGAAHRRALSGLESLYLQWGRAGRVSRFEDGFFDGLAHLELQAGVVDRIPPGLRIAPALRSLVIHDTTVELPTEVDWPSLESLRVGSAGPELPAALLLPTLTSLAISADGSQLRRLPDGLGRLDRLEQLDLRGNALTELPASLANLRALKHLGLRGNPLGPLPAWLAELPALETLSVDGELPAPLRRFAG